MTEKDMTQGDLTDRVQGALGLSRTGLVSGLSIPKREVALVFDISELLWTPDKASKILNLSGAGHVAALTVPGDEEWRLLAFYLQSTAANTRSRVQYTGGAVELSALGTAEQRFQGDLYMAPGWTIGATGTGNGADAAIGMEIIYLKRRVWR